MIAYSRVPPARGAFIARSVGRQIAPARARLRMSTSHTFVSAPPRDSMRRHPAGGAHLAVTPFQGRESAPSRRSLTSRGLVIERLDTGVGGLGTCPGRTHRRRGRSMKRVGDHGGGSAWGRVRPAGSGTSCSTPALLRRRSVERPVHEGVRIRRDEGDVTWSQRCGQRALMLPPLPRRSPRSCARTLPGVDRTDGVRRRAMPAWPRRGRFSRGVRG